MKRPSFQFYPSDWLTAPELRVCSIEARGLWIDMLCWMHQGAPYGHLAIGGKVILPPTLAKMEGYPLLAVEGWLKELEAVGVFSRRKDGCIFSRRMVRDEEIRQVRAAGGVKGGNPALKKARRLTSKVNWKDNLIDNHRDNLTIEDEDEDEECTPKGGTGGGEIKRELPILEVKEAVCALHGRDPGAPWGNDEEHYLVEVAKRPSILSELREVQRFYQQSEKKFLPQSVRRLLQDFTGVVDRARAHQRNSTSDRPKTILDRQLEEADRVIARAMRESEGD